MSNQQCNCPWERDSGYECGRVAIIRVTPQIEKEPTSLYEEPTLYCKKCLLNALEVGKWFPLAARVLPGKKLPKGIRDRGSFAHVWRKVNLITRHDGTDLVVCQKCGEEVVCHGFYRPKSQGCVIPDSD